MMPSAAGGRKRNHHTSIGFSCAFKGRLTIERQPTNHLSIDAVTIAAPPVAAAGANGPAIELCAFAVGVAVVGVAIARSDIDAAAAMTMIVRMMTPTAISAAPAAVATAAASAH